MRKFMVMAGLVVVAVACSSGADMLGEILDAGVPDAGAESPGDGTTMQYVGNSTKTFRGYRGLLDDNGIILEDEYGNPVRTGIFEYFAACQETFGAGHRTCEQGEIRFTTKIPQLEGLAWYGISSACAFPSGSSIGSRPAVRANGELLSTRCSRSGSSNSMLPIACCGPK